jgi:hypothetical protein
MAKLRSRHATKTRPADLSGVDVDCAAVLGWLEPLRDETRVLRTEAEFNAFLRRFSSGPAAWRNPDPDGYDLDAERAAVAERGRDREAFFEFLGTPDGAAYYVERERRNRFWRFGRAAAKWQRLEYRRRGAAA